MGHVVPAVVRPANDRLGGGRAREGPGAIGDVGLYHKQLLGDAPFVFDDRVRLLAPPFAEDARQVPLEIDARAFTGDVVRVLAWAELNPLPKIVDFQPGSECCPGCRSAFASSKPRRCAPPCRPAMACGTSARR